MERVQLGRSGLRVSPVSCGTWQLSPRFSGEQSSEETARAIWRAFDGGINLCDTADAYGDGHAKTVPGSTNADPRAKSWGQPRPRTRRLLAAAAAQAPAHRAVGHYPPNVRGLKSFSLVMLALLPVARMTYNPCRSAYTLSPLTEK